MSPFLQNITFDSVILGVITEQARPLMAGSMKVVIELATARPALLHSPKPIHIFRVPEVESAFRFVQSGKNGEKTVIEIHDDDVISTVSSTGPSWYFDGLGRRFARWMETRSAKHLVLLSRSGARGEAALTLLRELEGKGIEVIAPSCDISDESALMAALEHFPKRLPPTNGCIQASMVLKDGLFENMELENFNAALRPKVQGSWNLHAHLPKGNGLLCPAVFHRWGVWKSRPKQLCGG
ncbi:hypothetical protein ABVK25_009593 [Lepraria finkii]|uniref:Ketoreductase domain-containing protein n=1 Tax=Lepraria finkii TaxID=1340010 RepID=A0ABR4AWQ7_9LECA